MKSISFKNFRRFADFPEFRFGDITILVGGNNAGKSTLVRALKFLVSNLKHYRSNAIPNANSLLGNYMPEFYIGDQGNYLKIHKNDTMECMEFTLCCDTFGEYIREQCQNKDNDRYEIHIILCSAEPNDKYIRIREISIIDAELGFRVTFFDGERIKLEWIPLELPDIQIDNSNVPSEIEIPNETIEFESFLFNYKNEFNNYITAIDCTEISDIEANCYREALTTRREYIINHYREKGFLNFEKELILDVEGSMNPFENPDSLAELLNSVSNNIGIFHIPIKWRIKESAYRLEQIINDIYFTAPIYNSEHIDIYQSNDNISNVISRFYQNKENITFYHPKNKDYSPIRKKTADFLRELIQEFEIGKDYEIRPIDGFEAYGIRIQTMDDQWVTLSELGTGSIRLFQMFINILNSSSDSTFIFIEEPEQNLHPKMQSRLADAFYKFNELGYKFIIETHSEYLVRRSQALVAEMGFDEEELKTKNPFKVFYFPGKGVPYDMEYLPSGRFAKKFGEGFFDEAASSALTLSRIERRKKNG